MELSLVLIPIFPTLGNLLAMHPSLPHHCSPVYLAPFFTADSNLFIVIYLIMLVSCQNPTIFRKDLEDSL
jgi:hypothetical protein